ncbi:MAG: hypothetical protein LH481_14795 [Burkholderiales bacterium]|nr:hypothetical protein [Burkholderiales bacterium]
MYWLIILFSFPLLGSLVYFLVEFLPALRVDRGLKNAASAAVKIFDPTRELRAAKDAFELTPTAQNQIRLANALLDAGETAKAVEQFDQCMKGPFSKDPEIALSAAKAKLLADQPVEAVHLLTDIRGRNAGFRQEQLCLLLAQALAAAGKGADARIEFEDAVKRFGGVESKAEYAVWSATVGDVDTARRLQSELQQTWKHWDKHVRSLQAPLFKRVDAAIASAANR